MAEIVFSASGAADERRQTLTVTLTIGRSPDNALVLEHDLEVSRHHALIVCEGDQWFVADRGGGNGTFVNGERVTRRALRDGDLIRLGQTTLRYVDPIRRCSGCSAAVREGARFCDRCGEALAGAAPVEIPRTRFVPSADPAPAEVPQPQPSALPPRRSRRWPFVLFALAVLLVGGGSVWLWKRLGARPPGVPGAGTAVPALPGTTAAVNLAAGGRVELEGVTVAVSPNSGEGTAQVAVQRLASNPADSLGAPLTPTFNVELRAGGQPQHVPARPIQLAFPLLPGLGDPKLAAPRIIIRTQRRAGGPWQVENAMPRFDPRRRQVVFSLDHLSPIAGDTTEEWPGVTKVATAVRGPEVRNHDSPTGLFRIRYYESGSRSPRTDWARTIEHQGSSGAPSYVRDLAVYLERAFAALTSFRGRSGSPVFDRTRPARPIVVFVDDTGGDDGHSPVGGPITISNRLAAGRQGSLAAKMAGVAAHELVHLLQGQRYHLTAGLPSGLGDDWFSLRRVNRWFVEAVATYYARRAYPALLGDRYYFEASSSYLSVSLFADQMMSYYAAGHFLDWLDRKVGDGLVASALMTPDLLDSRALVAAVKSAGQAGLGDLYAEYCRALFCDQLARDSGDAARAAATRTIWLNAEPLHSRGTTSLYNEQLVERDELSALRLRVGTRSTTGAEGLLVVERGDGHERLSGFSYDRAACDGESYLEKLGAGAGPFRRSPDGRHLAFRGFGDAASRATLHEVVLLLVNGGDRPARATYRTWLLLPPSRIRIERETLVWEQSTRGFVGGVVKGYNVYRDGQKLNDALLTRRSFQHPSLKEAKDATGVVVSIVDRLGFEWPEPTAPAAGTDGNYVYRHTERTRGSSSDCPGTASLHFDLVVKGSTVTGVYSSEAKSWMLQMKGGCTLGQQHTWTRRLTGSFDPRTGRLSATMTGVHRIVTQPAFMGRQVGAPHKLEHSLSGRVEGELRGDVASVRIVSNPYAHYLAGDFRIVAKRAAPP